MVRLSGLTRFELPPPSPASSDEATRLARQHGVGLDLCKELLELEHQVRTPLSSRAVVEIEQAAGRSYPEGGEGYISALIDGCVERLGDVDERLAIQAEGNGLLGNELVFEGDPIPF